MHACLLVICLLGTAGPRFGTSDLARHIDQAIDERLAAEHVAPAERADDAEFLRRVSLDLIGHIPTAEEVEAFLQDVRPNKRGRLIEQRLADPQHARHFARVSRALLLPEAATDATIAYFQPGFEAWMAERRRKNAGFDAIVRELVSVPIARPDEGPQFVLKDLQRPNPIAFIAAKQADPAKLATSCARIFLGVRLECAECHDHPFDHWTRRQFWSQAAFFAGIERRGKKAAFAPLVEAVDRRSIRQGETDKNVPVGLLDGSEVHFEKQQSPRRQFADWMTMPRNPYFAPRTIVNRIWAQLMGAGLVNPVDDFRESNPATHPKLLEDLAEAFVASGFDLNYLYRDLFHGDLPTDEPAIARRSGTRRALRRDDDQTHVGGPVLRQPDPGDRRLSPGRVGADGGRGSGRRPTPDRAAFAADDEAEHPKTSVTQALALMNGSLVHEAVDPQSSRRLKRVFEAFPKSTDRQIESLYLTTLSRRPTETEKRLMLEYCGEATAVDHARRLGDVFWVLLNSAEFRWNH